MAKKKESTDGPVLGHMRCPLGATVSPGDDPKDLAGASIEDESIAVSADKSGKKTETKVSRCKESGPVSVHATLKETLTVLCPKHGAVLCNRKIWEKEVE